ncbi:MAG: DUF2254 domain-containing protein [Spirochaetes bacterium]|jgi:uncharacterized membrane protein|nr:DUF2254 domain-containing protein [Spirochaetota bacterium]
MRARLGKVRSALRHSFWFLPALLSILAAALSLAAGALGSWVDVPPVGWVYALGSQGIRDLLGMIAGSMITVATTAFSIIIVALQLASGQLGPRLLRNFIRDRGNQVVFGVFLGTFVYSALLLRTIGEDGELSSSTGVSVSFALLLAMIAVGVLIFFIHHAALSIQKDRVIARLSEELTKSVHKLYPKTIGLEPPEIVEDDRIVAQRLPKSATSPWEGIVDLRVENTGYIQAVDAKKLMNVVVAADIQVYLTKRPGDFVSHGAVVAKIRSGEHVCAKTERRLRDVFVLGVERTAQQDVAFVFDQLVEIGIRALSPGIYDSFTAMRCVDRLADALSLVARTPFPSPYRFDGEGNLRVITEPLNFAVLISLVLYPLAEAAAGHTNVVARLFGAIGEIGSACGEQREREALRRFNDYLLELSQSAPGRPVEYAGLDKLHEEANQIVGKPD